MSVEKLSISLPAELGTAIRAAAEADRVTVSAWFAGAARERLQAAAAQSRPSRPPRNCSPTSSPNRAR